MTTQVGAQYDRKLCPNWFASASQPDSVQCQQSTQRRGDTNLFYDANGNMTSDGAHSYTGMLGTADENRQWYLSKFWLRLFRAPPEQGGFRNAHLILV